MTGREIVKTVMDRHNFGVTELGERTGNSPQAIWRRLHEKGSRDITLSVLQEMLSTMGYKIVVVPQWCFVNPDGFVYSPDEGDNNKE